MPTGIYMRSMDCLERLKKQGFQKGKSKYWLGKHHSEETKRKISIKKKGILIKEKSSRWKGGRIFDKDGYILLFKPEHPQSNSKGYFPEHRFIVENIIGRMLKYKTESVHHINGIKDDNRPDNLILFSNECSHQKFENVGFVDSSEIIYDGRKGKNDYKRNN